MLADPIVQLVMRRDGLIAADIRLVMSVARTAVHAHPQRRNAETVLAPEAPGTAAALVVV